jgi:hypothetical protein
MKVNRETKQVQHTMSTSTENNSRQRVNQTTPNEQTNLTQLDNILDLQLSLTLPRLKHTQSQLTQLDNILDLQLGGTLPRLELQHVGNAHAVEAGHRA